MFWNSQGFLQTVSYVFYFTVGLGIVPWGLFGHQPINGIDFLDSVVCARIKVHGD